MDAVEAILNNDLKALKSMLESDERHQHFSYTDEYCGENILHEAVAAKKTECVLMIVNAYPSLTKKVNNNEETPLHFACRMKADLKIIKTLCEFKNTINLKNGEDNTALFEVLNMHDIDVPKEVNDGYICKVIKILIENGANIHVKGNYKFSLLHMAVYYNLFEEFKLLANFGVKMNKVDIMGRTVLHVATMNDKCEFLQFILKKNKNLVNVLDIDSNSVLLIASSSSCKNCVELLIKNNANVTQANKDGQTCIELAIKSGKHENVAKLLEYGADPSVYSGMMCCMPPFLYSCGMNQIEIVELLINHESINKYVINREKHEHPLAAAVKNGNPKMLKLLLSHPPFLDQSLVVSFLVKCHLVYCSLIGYFLHMLFHFKTELAEQFDGVLECCELLLQEKFSVNPPNGALSALTCLLLPSSPKQLHCNILHIVKILLKHGCKVNQMLISNAICQEYSMNVQIRKKLQVPDALAMAFISGNITVTKYLLRYWPQPPILLLLLAPKMSSENILKWCEILIEFGWPTGHKYAKQLEQFIHKREKEDEKIISLTQIENPSSLKCLAKFASRKYLFDKKSKFGKSLPELIESLDIPATLTQELLIVSQQEGAETEGIDCEKFDSGLHF